MNYRIDLLNITSLINKYSRCESRLYISIKISFTKFSKQTLSTISVSTILTNMISHEQTKEVWEKFQIML